MSVPQRAAKVAYLPPGFHGVALITQVRDQFRTLLRIRRQRTVPAAGQKPAVGSRIVCGELRMTVQAGMSDTLWRWLTKRGWREAMYRPDRRRYRDLPHALVTQLIDATPDHFDSILSAASAQAAHRPQTVRGGGARRSRWV
jgi:hypothetical protein